MTGRAPFVYVRDGETFTVGADGIRYVDVDGEVRIDRRTPVPDDVIASTIVDLVAAGWRMTTTDDA
jgi:hypothetical protein